MVAGLYDTGKPNLFSMAGPSRTCHLDVITFKTSRVKFPPHALKRMGTTSLAIQLNNIG